MVFVKGQIGTMRGKHQSVEARKKMSLAKKGKPSPLKGIKSGHIPWNKGKHLSEDLKKRISQTKGRMGKEISCTYCGKLKYYHPFKIKNNKLGKFYCSRKHQQLDQIKENNPSWKKNNNISYVQMHRRVVSDRGNAKEHICAMRDNTCKGRMEWASISHQANIDIKDYIPLCCSHHRRYDIRNKLH